MTIFEKEIPSSFDAVQFTVDEIDVVLGEIIPAIPTHIFFKIDFILRELLNNAVEHGNHFQVDKRVHCRIDYSDYQLTLQVSDEGEGFSVTDDTLSTYDTDDTDILLRDRNRGYPLLLEMAKTVVVIGSKVLVTIDLIER